MQQHNPERITKPLEIQQGFADQIYDSESDGYINLKNEDDSPKERREISNYQRRYDGIRVAWTQQEMQSKIYDAFEEKPDWTWNELKQRFSN